MSEQCKHRVRMDTGFGRFRICSRIAVQDGYCKQHHPDAKKARLNASIARHKEKIERDPLTCAYKQVTALTSERDALAQRCERLEKALRDLIGAYVRLMESGRDRIVSLGGDCDPVDVMERGDPYLAQARAALAASGKPDEGGGM